MSYDDSDLSALNTARALLADTSNDANELLTDDHIEAVLALYGYSSGVAFLARELDMRFARQPSSVSLPSGLSVSYARRTWASLIVAAQNGTLVPGASTAFSVASPRADGYATAESTDELGRPQRLWP